MANIKLRRKGKNTKRGRSNMIEASELLTPECVASANSSEKYEKYEKYEKKSVIVPRENCIVWHLLSIMIWQLFREEEQVKHMG